MSTSVSWPSLEVIEPMPTKDERLRDPPGGVGRRGEDKGLDDRGPFPPFIIVGIARTVRAKKAVNRSGIDFQERFCARHRTIGSGGKCRDLSSTRSQLNKKRHQGRTPPMILANRRIKQLPRILHNNTGLKGTDRKGSIAQQAGTWQRSSSRNPVSRG